MPIYMDRHDVSESVTAENIAELHQEDLKVQAHFGCRGLTYWFDEQRKMAFCLIEAPDEKTLMEMHRKAHGEVPNQVIEVEPAIVEAFLGRISDPANASNAPIDDSAFRILMLVNGPVVPDIAKLAAGSSGSVVNQRKNGLLVSFRSPREAVSAALKVRSVLNGEVQHSGKHSQFKVVLTAGVPVTDRKLIFEEAIKLAERISRLVKGDIIVSSDVSELYAIENINLLADEKNINYLTPSDESFLNVLMTYMEEHWANADLKVDDFNRPTGCSKSRLYRKLLMLAGESPNDFINRYRLEEAYNLLGKNGNTVAEVAFETGFTSPSYFTKCFQKRYGYLPSNMT